MQWQEPEEIITNALYLNLSLSIHGSGKTIFLNIVFKKKTTRSTYGNNWAGLRAPKWSLFITSQSDVICYEDH